MNLKEYLESIELTQYIESFEKNDVTFDVLKTLSDDDLKELGIESFGHRKTILNNLKSSTQANASNENPLSDKEKWSKQTIVSGLSIGTLLLPWISITSSASVTGFDTASFSLSMFGITTWIGDIAFLISAFMIYASLKNKPLFKIGSIVAIAYSFVAIFYLVPELGSSSSFTASAGDYSATANTKVKVSPEIGLILYTIFSIFTGMFASFNTKTIKIVTIITTIIVILFAGLIFLLGESSPLLPYIYTVI